MGFAGFRSLPARILEQPLGPLSGQSRGNVPDEVGVSRSFIQAPSAGENKRPSRIRHQVTWILLAVVRSCKVGRRWTKTIAEIAFCVIRLTWHSLRCSRAEEVPWLVLSASLLLQGYSVIDIIKRGEQEHLLAY